jgi:hypothetical protein
MRNTIRMLAAVVIVGVAAGCGRDDRAQDPVIDGPAPAAPGTAPGTMPGDPGTAPGMMPGDTM